MTFHALEQQLRDLTDEASAAASTPRQRVEFAYSSADGHYAWDCRIVVLFRSERSTARGSGENPRSALREALDDLVKIRARRDHELTRARRRAPTIPCSSPHHEKAKP